MTAPQFRYDFADLGPAHVAVVDAVPHSSRVLEVGCATGYMTAALAQRGCRVAAIDIDAAALDRARRFADEAHVVDLDSGDLPWSSPDFDCIVCADVLEHLRDPTATLRRLAHLLQPGGTAVVSLPNVAFWRVRWQLGRGRFDYEEQGILDRTHLRFFTLRTAHELVNGAGLSVLRVIPISETFPLDNVVPVRMRRPKHLLNGLAFRVFPRLFAYQYVLVLTRPCVAG